MITTRREFFRHVGLGSAVALPALLPKRAMGAVFINTPMKTSPSITPRVHTSSTLKHAAPHHQPVHKHLPKHHKHRHHYRKHTSPDSQRALHTLNTPGDRHDLALTMWGEARSLVRKHGEEAMIAIGCVILNRVKWDHHATGHGIHGVCHKNKQFSCWNKNDNSYQAMLDLVKQDENTPDWKMWVLANQIAGKLLAGVYKDITGGATHYANESIVVPYWRHDMIIIGVMFGHSFYKQKLHHRTYSKHSHKHKEK